jgi:hypothetical protein
MTIEWNTDTYPPQTVGEWYWTSKSTHCNGSHYVEACPRVVEVEYCLDGSIKRVKLETTDGS